jgi:hypothetical protein
MKILKIFAVCFVLLNFTLFNCLSTTAYSKNGLTNEENSVLYEKFLSEEKVNESSSELSSLSLQTVITITYLIIFRKSK